MVAEPQPPRWTVDAYLEMERGSPIKHEYLDGHVYAMAGGTRRHSRLGVNVTAALNGLLHGGPCQVFNSNMKVRVDAKNYVYPDVAVSCDARDTVDDTLDSIGYPVLIVEVLSDDSTAGYDRGDKFTLLYQRLPTLREYMLVESTRIGVTVYRRQDDDTWLGQTYGTGETIALASIGVSMPLTALYSGIAR